MHRSLAQDAHVHHNNRLEAILRNEYDLRLPSEASGLTTGDTPTAVVSHAATVEDVSSEEDNEIDSPASPRVVWDPSPTESPQSPQYSRRISLHSETSDDSSTGIPNSPVSPPINVHDLDFTRSFSSSSNNVSGGFENNAPGPASNDDLQEAIEESDHSKNDRTTPVASLISGKVSDETNREPTLLGTDSTSNPEPPSRTAVPVPNTAHLATVANLSEGERVALMQRFLRANAARFETFRVNKQPKNDTDSSSSATKTAKFVNSNIWNNINELGALTDAILWLDKLLSAFRTEVLADDVNILKPRLEECVKQLQLIDHQKVPGARKQLGAAEMRTVREFSDEIAAVQRWNEKRKRLLEMIEIDVTLFADLLLSAETAQHRFDVLQRHRLDELVNALRRIYSTLVCTVPFGYWDSVWDPARIEDEKDPDPRIILDVRLEELIQLLDSQQAQNISGVDTNLVSQGRGKTQHPEPPNCFSEGLGPVRGGLRPIRGGPSPFSKEFWDLQDQAKARTQNPASGLSSSSHASTRAQRSGPDQSKEQENQRRSNGNNRPSTQNRLNDHHLSVEGEDSNHGDEPSSTSPLSSSSLDSDTEIIIHEVVSARGPFCLYVNTPGGCKDRDRCGYKSHANEGKLCNQDPCRFGKRCAFVHAAQDTADSVQPRVRRSSSLRAGSDSQADLRLNLDQVLADPESWRVCKFVNKPRGCTAGATRGVPCKYNHSLEGVACEDFARGNCSRGKDCPLMHVKGNASVRHQPGQLRERSSTSVQGGGSTVRRQRWNVLQPQQNREPYAAHSSNQGLDISSDGPDISHFFPQSASGIEPYLPPQGQQQQSPSVLPSGTPRGPRGFVGDVADGTSSRQRDGGQTLDQGASEHRTRERKRKQANESAEMGEAGVKRRRSNWRR